MKKCMDKPESSKGFGNTNRSYPSKNILIVNKKEKKRKKRTCHQLDLTVPVSDSPQPVGKMGDTIEKSEIESKP